MVEDAHLRDVSVVQKAAPLAIEPNRFFEKIANDYDLAQALQFLENSRVGDPRRDTVSLRLQLHESNRRLAAYESRREEAGFGMLEWDFDDDDDHGGGGRGGACESTGDDNGGGGGNAWGGFDVDYDGGGWRWKSCKFPQWAEEYTSWWKYEGPYLEEAYETATESEFWYLVKHVIAAGAGDGLTTHDNNVLEDTSLRPELEHAGANSDEVESGFGNVDFTVISSVAVALWGCSAWHMLGSSGPF